MTLHVLHVAAPADGGVPRYVAGLARDGLARGWRVTVAAPAEGDLARELAGSGAGLVPWRARRNPGLSSLAETRRLREIFREARPDLVHLHAAKAGLAGRLALRGRTPTVFQPHAWSFEAASGVVRRGALAWERRAARWADAIVCVSEDERRRGEEAGIRGVFRVIRNGVDLEAFPPAGPEERAAARARLGLGDAPLVVCVGRLSRQKGQDVLLDAWPLVLARVRDARLALVGEGPDWAALAARTLPGMSLPGARDDVPDWLAAANVVALPSRWEGMSLALLEAMASGRSIVATDVSGSREALGDAGAIVPVEDAPALAEALVARLRDPASADAEGLHARRRAEAHHDERTPLAAVAALYAELSSSTESVNP